MQLAIDIGNTETVFGVYKNNKRIQFWRIPSSDTATGDEIAATIITCMGLEKITPTDIKQIVVASVRESILTKIKELSLKYFKIKALNLDQKLLLSLVKSKIDSSVKIGADRLVNSWAIYQQSKKSSIVVDFGTATNFDIIDKSGAFIGGIIAPGLELSYKALVARAANLTQAPLISCPEIIGKDTASAMQSGVYWGYTYMIEGILKKLTENDDTFVIATGGLSSLFHEQSHLFNAIDPFLTLDGINLIGGKYDNRAT